ncbi:MAG: DEAD/DEAH box helicase, partial [Asgard group archaeon]
RKLQKFLKIVPELKLFNATIDFDQIPDTLLEDFDIIVTTYGRFTSIIQLSKQEPANIDLVAVDEVQTISEKGKGARLESILLWIKNMENTQKIYLSKPLNNPEKIASWLEAKLQASYKRFYPLKYRFEIIREKQSFLKKNLYTLLEKGQIIVFTKSRDFAKLYAKELKSLTDNTLTEREKKELKKIIDTENSNRSDLPLLYVEEYQGLIESGVAFHHAGLDPGFRDLVEKLFHKGFIKVLTCTPTLFSRGNLSVRTVVLTDTFRMRKNLFHQLCSLASGSENGGEAIILLDSPAQIKRIKEVYFENLKPKYDDIPPALVNLEELGERLLLFIVNKTFSGKESKGITLEELFRSFYKVLLVRDKDHELLLRILLTGQFEDKKELLLFNRLLKEYPARLYYPLKGYGEEKSFTSYGVKMDRGKLRGIVRAKNARRFTYTMIELSDMGVKKVSCTSCSTQDSLCWHVLATLVDSSAPISLLEKTVRKYCITEDLYSKGFIKKVKEEKSLTTPLYLKPTRKGISCINLYLQPSTYKYIESEIFKRKIKKTHDLIFFALDIYDKDRGKIRGEKAHYVKAFINYLDGKSFGKRCPIEIGDLISVKDSLSWLISCIVSICYNNNLTTKAELYRRIAKRLRKIREETKNQENVSVPFF